MMDEHFCSLFDISFTNNKFSTQIGLLYKEPPNKKALNHLVQKIYQTVMPLCPLCLCGMPKLCVTIR
jgi:hypothetical protein